MGYRVAVVGATGNVGREMLSILAERNFPADDVVALLRRGHGWMTMQSPRLDGSPPHERPQRHSAASEG